jgi:5-methylcytosine-specific restriction protein A
MPPARSIHHAGASAMPWSSKIHRPVCKRLVQRAKAKLVVSRSKRGYTKEWDRASREYLAQNPLCAECMRQGIRSPSQVTDHIVPHKGDMILFWDRSNWQPLCKRCHDRKTAIEDGGFGK